MGTYGENENIKEQKLDASAPEFVMNGNCKLNAAAKEFKMVIGGNMNGFIRSNALNPSASEFKMNKLNASAIEFKPNIQESKSLNAAASDFIPQQQQINSFNS